MDSLAKILVFVLIFLTVQYLVSGQCLFDGSNSFLTAKADEKTGVGMNIRNFTSAVIETIPDLTLHKYIQLVFNEEERRLDVLVIAPLEGYFRDPDVSNENILLTFTPDCGSTAPPQLHRLTTEVIDSNDPAEFESASGFDFNIQTPWDLSVPINWGREIFVIDWDFKEEFSNSITIRSDSDKVVVSQEMSPTKRPRKYSLKISLREQLTETLNFKLIASDPGLPGRDVEKDVTIQVSPINTHPPKFDKYFYKAVIPGLPKKGDPITMDGGPIKVTDQENIPFIVSSSSDLIDVQDSGDGSYNVIFNRDVTEDELNGFEHGVALLDVTAKETGSDGFESSIVLVMFFSEVFATTKPPEVTTTACPELTTFTETPATNCPDITTLCPETGSTTLSECTCEPCSTTEASSTACPELTTIYMSTPCPDSTSTKNTPFTSTTSASSETECPVCTSTSETTSSSSSECPEQTTIYVSTPCPGTTCTESTPVTSPSDTTSVTDCPDICTTSTLESIRPNCPTTTVSTCAPCECVSTTESLFSSTSIPCPITEPTECSCPTLGPSPITEPPECSCPTLGPCPITEPPECSCPTLGTCPITPECSCPTPGPCPITEPPECSCPTSNSPQYSCPTSEPCPTPVPIESESPDIGFVIGLIVLGVLLLGSVAAIGYMWQKLRKRNNDPMKFLKPDPWNPESVDVKTHFNVERMSDTPMYDNNNKIDLPRTSILIESDPHTIPYTSEFNPVNFDDIPGKSEKGSLSELSQATNPLVETTTIIPTPEPQPAIPRPDYPKTLIFDERVEVFTPVVQEYSDDEGGEDVNEKGGNSQSLPDEFTNQNDGNSEIANDDNQGDARL